MKLDIITSLYVFMLAAFIGFEIIRRVSPLLHTPLMSLTNALDAIAVVGAIILAGEHKTNLAAILGTIAIVADTSNIVGGFLYYKLVAIGLVLGCIIGVPLGKVAMTAVPQRTALSHAFGALCVTLVGTSEFYLRAPNISPFMMAVLSMEVILGSLTFTGS